MNLRTLSLATLLGFGLAASLGAQQYHQLPVGSWANDVTPDGSVVVGTWNFSNGFIWRWKEDCAPTEIVGGDIVAISDDGSVAAGNFFDANLGTTVAGRWTEANGWESILDPMLAPCGSSYSSAYDISGDGTTIVGLGWDGCNAKGFRWTEANGMELLEELANGVNRASTISADGSIIGGFAQGSFTRTPAYWMADLSGVAPDPDDNGEVYGFSNDGTYSVGTRDFGGTGYGAFINVTSDPSNYLNLGKLNNGWGGNATDITEDASFIVGYDVNGLARQAWVWTSADGIVSLEDWLSDQGIVQSSAAGPIPGLFVCRKVSDDGEVIVGGGLGGSGGPFGFAGFVVTLEDGSWQDLGGGTAGINGVPELDGFGLLTPDCPTTVRLRKGAPNTPTLAWWSLNPAPLAAIGGTVHAFPFVNQFLFNTDADGAFQATVNWPAGVPAGTEVFFQFIVSDPSSIHGLTLSNGLKATTPAP